MESALYIVASIRSTYLIVTRLGVCALGLSSTTSAVIDDVVLVHGSLLVLLCRIVSICLMEVETKSHAKNLVGVGSVWVNGILNAGLVLLDGDLALASTAGVVVVASDASGGLGGVLGRHVGYVIWWS